MNDALLFVYGTLKQGYRLHHFLTDQTYLGQFTVKGDLYDLGSYPGFKQGEGKVYGELYDITKPCLVSIDAVEGEGHLFRRIQIQVDNAINPDHGSAWAWIYEFIGNIPQSAKIQKGIWEKHFESKNSHVSSTRYGSARFGG